MVSFNSEDVEAVDDSSDDGTSKKAGSKGGDDSDTDGDEYMDVTA